MLNKEDLIRRTKGLNDAFSLKQLREVTTNFLAVLADAAAHGEEINLDPFGRLHMVRKPERECTDPRDGSKMTIGPRTYPKFRVAGKVKEKVKKIDAT